MRYPNRRTFATVTAATFFNAAYLQGAKADGWTSWRGPERDGYSPHPLPSNLTDSLREVWSVPLGDSYSGPLVLEDRIFVTETLERKYETVKALRREDGRELWSKRWEGAMSVPFFAKSNGDWIRSTPATDGNVIVVGGMRDVLECLDVRSGESRWRVDFNQQLGGDLPAFGLVCSPLIDGTSVYVQAGGGVRKLDLASGETKWLAFEDKGGMNGGAFSSPIIAELSGQRQLIVQTRTTLGGIDLENGKVLWQQDIASFRGMNILTPSVWHNHVYTSCYGGRSLLFKIERGASGWSASQVWEGKAEAYMSSPVIVDDHLYMHLRNQRLCCIRLADGVETWRSKPYGKYWSMVTDGKTILGLDETGTLYALRANPQQLEILDEREVSNQPSWAHLAVADNQLFIRHQKGLVVLAGKLQNS
jgi:outer membrane protein assembly factor BamB